MMELKGKKISIIGAVRSGVGAAKLAKRVGAVPFVSDTSPYEKLQSNFDELIAREIEFEFGGHSERVFDCDVIVTSPGVPGDSTVLKEAKARNIKVISELEFAWMNCKGKIIAITGTNGKTTTTALCAHTLNTAGIKCYEAGNIGLAFSEIAADVAEDEFVALEISSFQLDHVDKFSPYISIILNITPDHLDRYENSVEKYTAAKMRIATNQSKDQVFVRNYDDKKIPDSDNTTVQQYFFSLVNKVANGAFVYNNRFVFTVDGTEEELFGVDVLSLKGLHNRQNAMAVLTAAKLAGCSNDAIEKAFSTFKGVEHRLEFVRTINDVDYINDSKATNVDSVWYALQSYEKPIYLILGGKDKGNDYSSIEELVRQHVKKIYAIGSSSGKVMEFFNPMVNVISEPSLEDCVSTARQEAEPGSVVLLSPACASFDMFDNYEHRGKVFKEAVMSLN